MELYRYVNDKGVVVLDRQGVPPQYIGKGYQVLNDQGRVIRTVPPAPTAEELRQRKAAQAQASSDAQLLRLYSSLEDVDRARERRLAELDGLSSVARGNLQSLKLQQANLQGQAANQERAGRPVAQALVDQLDDLKQEEKRLQGEIGRFQKAREEAERTYAADRARLSQLLGVSPRLHWRLSLERPDLLAQPVRYGLALSLVRIRIDVDQLADGEQLLVAPDAQLENQAAAPQPRHAGADVQPVVEMRRGAVFQGALHREQVASAAQQVGRVGHAELAVVLGGGDV